MSYIPRWASMSKWQLKLMDLTKSWRNNSRDLLPSHRLQLYLLSVIPICTNGV